jgi:hypothetical protein
VIARWPVLATAVIVVSVTLSACSGVSHPGSAIAHGHNVSVFLLRKGNCVVPPTTVRAEVSQVEVVPCEVPHTQEVFALVNYKQQDTYPGSSALKTFADAACLEGYAGYVGVDYRDSQLFYTYLLPSARSWNSDKNDRQVVCLITTTGQPLTGSIKGSRR